MKKEKKSFAAAQMATIAATRWTGNKLLFKGGLRKVSLASYMNIRWGQHEQGVINTFIKEILKLLKAHSFRAGNPYKPSLRSHLDLQFLT